MCTMTGSADVEIVSLDSSLFSSASWLSFLLLATLQPQMTSDTINTVAVTQSTAICTVQLALPIFPIGQETSGPAAAVTSHPALARQGRWLRGIGPAVAAAGPRHVSGTPLEHETSRC